MKISKTERVIQELASKWKYFCMTQSLFFRLHNIPSAYFNVWTWNYRQTIRLFMGIKYMYSFYMVPLMVFEIEASNFKLSFYDFLQFAYDCINPPISHILLCIFVKWCSTHRSCDAEENGLHVDGFALSHRLVRSDGNLKRRSFFYKERAIWGR